MASNTTRFRSLQTLLLNDSLFRNATYLMSSTAIMSALGFLFWVFVAHWYAPSAIGIAAALISITTLLSNLSLFGLNAGLIRFLPSARHQSRNINATIAVVAGMSIAIAAGYVLVAPLLHADLPLLASWGHKLAFIALMAAVSLNTLTDAVFIANRRAEFHTLTYAAFGFVKLILPLFLVGFGSLGIFGAYSAAVVVSLLLSYAFMRRTCHYRLLVRPNWAFITRARRFAIHNHIGMVLSGLPSQILPLLIIRRLSAAQAAYFSIAWTMANLLYIVPLAAGQSLLAESSHQPAEQIQFQRRTNKLLIWILVPTVAAAVLVAPYLLNIFGANYRRGATAIFRLLALMTFFVAFNVVSNNRLNMGNRTKGIVIVQLVSVTSTFAATMLLLRFGLVGVGWAMLLGTASGSLAHIYLHARHRQRLSQAASRAILPQSVFDRPLE